MLILSVCAVARHCIFCKAKRTHWAKAVLQCTEKFTQPIVHFTAFYIVVTTKILTKDTSIGDGLVGRGYRSVRIVYH